MESIAVGKLKAEFSAILEKVHKSGESFIVEYGRKHEKVAMIIPYDSALEDKDDREFGVLEESASFEIKDDFEMTDEDLIFP
jgi:antitoxin (DNA-binding transcriptional repressor) of toxin-antitoxin stability system